MNDKWNPRLWLRKWLNRPSPAEAAELRRVRQRLARISEHAAPGKKLD